MADMVMILAWVGAVVGPLIGWRVVRRWRSLGPAARTGSTFFAALYGLGVWAFLIEPETLSVRHVTVESAAWQGPPLRIGILSDTHVGAPHVTPARVGKVVARLSKEAPDIVVFLGDYVGGHAPAGERTPQARAEIAQGIAALGGVRAPLGRIAVLGNHDWWYDGPAVEKLLSRSGLFPLENQTVRITRPTGAFWVSGVADAYSQRTRPSVEAALAGVASGEPVILLSHFPDIFETVPGRVALTLAGHSHCGQVNLPFVGRPITPSPGSARWPCGLYEVGGRQLYVTGGLGVSILPLRFRAPPEIVIVTLRARP